MHVEEVVNRLLVEPASRLRGGEGVDLLQQFRHLLLRGADVGDRRELDVDVLHTPDYRLEFVILDTCQGLEDVQLLV